MGVPINKAITEITRQLQVPTMRHLKLVRDPRRVLRNAMRRTFGTDAHGEQQWRDFKKSKNQVDSWLTSAKQDRPPHDLLSILTVPRRVGRGTGGRGLPGSSKIQL